MESVLLASLGHPEVEKPVFLSQLEVLRENRFFHYLVSGVGILNVFGVLEVQLDVLIKNRYVELFVSQIST